ncbi:hypothetical protein ALC57_00021, partial [Trachymyrmex cornetzi]
NLSKNHTLLFQSFPNLLFPIPRTCPIIATAFATISSTCSSCPPFLCIVYTKYLNFFTSSISFPFHLQFTLLLLPLPFLKLRVAPSWTRLNWTRASHSA